MIKLNVRYVVDENGNQVGVLLDIADYHKLLEDLEELESIRAYDAAKASGEETIPFEQAVLPRLSGNTDESAGIIQKGKFIQ
ncbi:MAG: hypothetical protein ACUZ77_04145 [Candidatus Brocadiales bacterium]